MSDRLFPAVLKYWRGRRGLSQLDLALAADVSSRHVSFLETGRAQPSAEMVLQLLAALDVPLRDQNRALESAGFSPRFPEPTLEAVPAAVDLALARMMAQQEPFPLTVMTTGYDIVRANRASERLFARFVAEPEHLPTPLNLFTLLFDPRLLRPSVVDWEKVARSMMARLHRESLRRREDLRLSTLVEHVLELPGVPREFRQPDFAAEIAPIFTFQLRRDGFELSFLTAMTTFTAPQQVTLEELRIESLFPLDEATRIACEEAASV